MRNQPMLLVFISSTENRSGFIDVHGTHWEQNGLCSVVYGQWSQSEELYDSQSSEAIVLWCMSQALFLSYLRPTTASWHSCSLQMLEDYYTHLALICSMWRHAYKFFYHTYETWNFKWSLTFCCNTCILTEGWTDKKHPRQKTKPWTKTPANNWETICTGGFCQGFFVLGLLKIGGSEMCDVLLGGPGMCDKVRQERGVKSGQK